MANEASDSHVITHGKSVELLELFNDLIYVYAIAQMTGLLHHAEHGITPFGVLQYLIACLVVLQAWLFQTNYVNRFGRHSWTEHAFVCVNMVAVLFLSNTISTDWASMAMPFSVSMCAMLASTAALYLTHSLRGEPGARFARNVCVLLAAFALVYLVVALCASLLPANTLSFILSAMVVVGAIVPSLVKGGFNPAFVDAGHLVERFELLVILTFGETIVALTGLFDVSSFSPAPVLVFLNVVLLFGTYVVFVHRMLDHHLKDKRGLALMYTHFAMVIGINLLTVAMPLTTEGGDVAVGLGVVAASSVVFYGALFLDNVYAREGYALTVGDIALAIVFIAVGLAVSYAASSAPYGLLAGVFITRAGVFGAVLNRWRAGNVQTKIS